MINTAKNIILTGMSVNSQSIITFQQEAGRIKLTLAAMPLGHDYWAAITGGAAHAGAVALACPGQNAEFLQAHAHRDGEIAAAAAEIIANDLNCRATVACGIHYDYITPGEIENIRKLSRQLAMEMVDCIKRKEQLMLTMAELKDFEKRLQSGEVDECFKCADERERGEILELLEKIMDVADLANETATRLIFRGKLQ